MSFLSTVILDVHVDDILLAGDDIGEMDSLKCFLDDRLKIQDFGDIYYFLGLAAHGVPQGFLVSQHKYTKELIEEFHCSGCYSVVIPLELYPKLLPNSRTLLPDPSSFRKLVGKLNSLQHTRPDIFFSVQQLSQFLKAPSSSLMQVVLHVLRYLLTDLAKGIFLSNSVDFTLKHIF